MEITNLIPHIEALIFASDKPLTSLDITDLLNNAFGFMEDKISLDQVEAAIDGITEKYSSEFYPIEMRQSGGGDIFDAACVVFTAGGRGRRDAMERRCGCTARTQSCKCAVISYRASSGSLLPDTRVLIRELRTLRISQPMPQSRALQARSGDGVALRYSRGRSFRVPRLILQQLIAGPMRAGLGIDH